MKGNEECNQRKEQILDGEVVEYESESEINFYRRRPPFRSQERGAIYRKLLNDM